MTRAGRPAGAGSDTVTLATPLAGVIGRSARLLGTELGLRTVGDLLRHYPRRYVERGELTPFADLRPGDHATVVAEVARVRGKWIEPKGPGKKRLHKTDVTLRDAQGRTFALVFFNQRWLPDTLTVGRHGYFSGRVSTFQGVQQLAQPAVQLLERDDEADPAVEAVRFAGGFVPLYPATAKADSPLVQRCIKQALDVVDAGPEPLPHALLSRHALMGHADALRAVHAPADREEIDRARTRLTWDEALVMQVLLAQRRASAAALPGTPRPAVPDGLLAAFDAALPFALTGGQREIGAELAAELALPSPLHRLLQGEVGSGKTVVALRAMLQVVDAGGQAALLAPTEVLAAQHLRSLRAMLGPLATAGQLGAPERATQVVLMTGSQGAAARREAVSATEDGAAGLVVGTHALLSEGVRFRDLGLVVVDEQHRFGVEQRDALRAKGAAPPHVLVMTATPIPRTIAMTVYGDLEVSTLRELPRGRSPVRSAVVPIAEKPAWLDTAWQRVREHVEQGRQAFVVCPRVGEDDEPEGPADDDGQRRTAAATTVAAWLAEHALAGLRLALLHGRLPSEEKDAVMAAFVRGEVDVLVATTVVEVGVDVPNATVMVVLDADRFGVSQLHQLRGRVGRGAHAALCLLVTSSPPGSPARERLDAVAATTDGFALSRVDLEQRREGDVLGQAQSGRRSSLRLLRLLDHEPLIAEARAEATALVAADPSLEQQPGLRQAVDDVLDAERADYLDKA